MREAKGLRSCHPGLVPSHSTTNVERRHAHPGSMDAARSCKGIWPIDTNVEFADGAVRRRLRLEVRGSAAVTIVVDVELVHLRRVVVPLESTSNMWWRAAATRA